MAEALGMIECRSFAAMVEASDAMVKAAKFWLASYGPRSNDCWWYTKRHPAQPASASTPNVATRMVRFLRVIVSSPFR